MGLLSPEEKIYVVHGVEQNVRADGRSRCQYRPIEVETGVLPSCMGSARVRVGGTDVVAAVKANTFTPPPNRPSEGQLELLVSFSGTADPDNEGRAAEQAREQLSHVVNKLYSTVDLKKWVIADKLKCWKFNVDVCVTKLDGNLYDAVGFAVKSALASTEVPVVKATNEDKGKIDFTISEDPNETWAPDVSDFPILVTASKIGDAVVFDCSAKEELCGSFSCVVACTRSGSVQFVMKCGAGSLHPSTLTAVLNNVTTVGMEMDRRLLALLSSDKSRNSREIFGYM